MSDENYALDLMVGSATGAAAVGSSITMKNGSLTLDEKGGGQPYVVGLLVTTTAIAREAYVNFKVDVEGAKTEDYRRIYPTILNDAPNTSGEGFGFYPVMKQFKKGDILDIRVVDVATTVLMTVGIYVSYTGPPKLLDPSQIAEVWSIGVTAGTPADGATSWSAAGVDDIASGKLQDFPELMDIIGGYVIPENAQIGGIRMKQAFALGLQPGLTPGSGFLMIGGKFLVIATVNNFTLIENECVVVAASELEGGYHAVPA